MGPQKTFVTKNSSLCLNTKKAAQFLFRCLSDLVPYEKPEYLKVHIFKSPQVTGKFKDYVDDYVTLAKTRLADLNVPLEDNAGIFRQSTGTSNDEQAKAMEQARADVDKVLSLYGESNRVPAMIMEASIFRKPYFIGRFLPALLALRKPPAEADVRARLIEDLNRAGKIPASMLRSYQKKCEKFQDSLPDCKPRDDVQQFIDSLEKLPMVVQNVATGEDASNGLTSCLSAISRKMKIIFSASMDESVFEVVDLDLGAVNITSEYLQVSYALINVFCRACAAVQSVRPMESVVPNRDVRFHWASSFVAMLMSFPRLVESMYVHLWNTLYYQPHLLRNDHISGLAILTCHLVRSKSCQGRSIRLQSPTQTETKDYRSFVDLVVNQIALVSRNSMKFFIRWCCYYLQYAIVAFETVTTNVRQVTTDGCCYIPETMIIKIQYLFNKFKFRKDEFKNGALLEEKTWDLLSLLMKSLDETRVFQNLSRIEFREWLTWELNIEEDILLENERRQYYNWVIYEYFIPHSKRKDKCSNRRETVSLLFSALMNRFSSSHESGKRCPTEASLVKIFQDMVSLVGMCDGDESVEVLESSTGSSGSIWLLDCFISRHKETNVSEHAPMDLRLCCEVMAFLRLVTQLPPWLLMYNSEWESPSQRNTKKLICCFNSYLKPYFFQETFVVPFDFTTHLFKAFFPTSLNPESDHVRLCCEEFLKFTRDTPFYFGSFLHYWSQLKPLCERYIGKSEELERFKCYHLWLKSMFHSVESHYVDLPEDTGEEPGLAYAIFLDLKKRLDDWSCFAMEESDDTLGILNRLLDILSACGQGKRVILCLYDNIMAYLVSAICHGNQIKEEKYWFEISMSILSCCPDVLHILKHEREEEDEELSDVRTKLVSGNFWKLLPIVFFRTVMYQPKKKLEPIMAHEAFVEVTLSMYNHCSNLYKGCTESSYSSTRFKPLDLEFFVQVRRFVNDVLMSVSPAILGSLPEITNMF